MLFNLKDNIGLILKGTNYSENKSDIDHVSIVRDLDFPSIKLFEDLENIMSGDYQADCKIKFFN